jgi:hypothetical protein
MMQIKKKEEVTLYIIKSKAKQNQGRKEKEQRKEELTLYSRSKVK